MTFQTAANYREEVRVFKKFHANVIGKGGATLRKLREETDTKIELPGEKNDSDVIVITGKKENVQKARARIQAIEKEMVRKRKSSHLVRFLCVSVFFLGGGGGNRHCLLLGSNIIL